MKKHISIIVITAFLFCGCDILDDEIEKRSITYTVTNLAVGNSNVGAKTIITYLDNEGTTLFEDITPGRFWTITNSKFSKGDRVSLAVNSPNTSGTITIRIRCSECEDLGGNGGKELVKTVNLSVFKNGVISANLD